ncbi:hypothetical protein D3C85_551550 [compost metagenome]
MKQRNGVFGFLKPENSNRSDDSEQFRTIPIHEFTMDNLDAYKKAVKAKYELEKSGKFSDYFINPSPAKLKNLCVLLFEANTNLVDEGVFDNFFNFKEGENKIKQIRKFDTDKFRPFKNFLIQNTDISQIESLNLIAVLVDFNPRPYLKFRTADLSENDKEETPIENLKKGNRKIRSTAINLVQGFEPIKRFSRKKKVLLGFVVLLIVASLGYSFKNIFFPEKNGMVWKGDHYESIELEAIKNGIDVKPINLFEVENFKKIVVTDTTTFFKNGNEEEPLVWYGKDPKTKKYEYFSQPGIHPITGKTLKKITPYIIKKYCSE